MLLPYHKRPRCCICKTRAAVLNPEDREYSLPCRTCVRKHVKVYRQGSRIKGRIRGTGQVFDIGFMAPAKRPRPLRIY